MDAHDSVIYDTVVHEGKGLCQLQEHARRRRVHDPAGHRPIAPADPDGRVQPESRFVAPLVGAHADAEPPASATATRLDPVQVGIGPGHERLEGVSADDRGESGAHGSARTERREGLFDLSDARGGDRECGFGEGAYELVAPSAHDDVVGAQRGGDRRRHVAQEKITGGMSMRVVDGLQRVHVDHGEDQAVTRPTRPVELVRERQLPGAATKDAGQLVKARTASIRGSPLAVLSRGPAVLCRRSPLTRRALSRRCGDDAQGPQAIDHPCVCAQVQSLVLTSLGFPLVVANGPITVPGSAIACQCRQIALPGRLVAFRGRRHPQGRDSRPARGRRVALLADRVAFSPRRLVALVAGDAIGVAMLLVGENLVAIRRVLIALDQNLVGVGKALVEIGRALVRVGQALVGVGGGLVVVGPGMRPRGIEVRLRPASVRPASSWREPRAAAG